MKELCADSSESIRRIKSMKKKILAAMLAGSNGIINGRMLRKFGQQQ